MHGFSTLATAGVLVLLLPALAWGQVEIDLILNQSTYVPGNTFRADVVIANPSPETVTGDVFMGFVFPTQGPCPLGDRQVVFLTNGSTGTQSACLSTAAQVAEPNFTDVTIPAYLAPTRINNVVLFTVPLVADLSPLSGPSPKNHCTIQQGEYIFFVILSFVTGSVGNLIQAEESLVFICP